MAPPIRLPSDRPSALAQSIQKLRQVRGFNDLRKWSLKSFRLADLPLRIRPAFIVLTFLTLLILSLLGFHPTLATHLAPPDVPISDKVLHFFCFGIATALFYACWVVEEHARRVWLWRYFKEIVTIVVCMLFGGIGSEFLQSLLPYKTFQPGDVLANLLGSGLALALSHHFAREARRSAELRRLYTTLDQISDDEEDDEEPGVEGREREQAVRDAPREMEEGRATPRAQGQSRREARDPWSAREDEIFGLGDDEDGDELRTAGRRGGGPL